MVDAVTSGTVAQSGTKLYVMGTASGIDTSALVDAAYDQKVAKADTIDLKVASNTAKITAYQTLQSLSTALSSSLSTLKNSYGYSTTSTSVYDSKKAYLTTSDGTDASSLLSVTVDDTAEKGSYSVEVVQLAAAMKISSDTQSSKTTALGMSGTFSLSLGSGSSQDIVVTSDMTLQDVAKAINTASSTTNVKASIVRVSDNEYSLVLTGGATGQQIALTSVAGDDVLQSLGVTDSDGAVANLVQEATMAKVNLDGIELTSTTNNFDDVMDGVSFSLVGASPGTNITLEVDYDYSSTKDAITAFVDAYNNYRDFVLTNQTVATDGTVSDDAVLYGDTSLKTLNNEVFNILTDKFSSSDGLSTLRELGITFTTDNKLEISDEDALNNALLNNYEDVKSIFQTSVETDNSNISLIRNSSLISSQDITLQIATDDIGNITSVTANGVSDAFTIQGTLITGKKGTAYEGLVFAYIGGTSATINISLQQGLADRLSNTMTKYANTTDGIIQDQITNLQTTNDKLDTESTRIREKADAFRDKEVERYARMESEISAANLLLKQIRAILGTTDDSSSSS